MSKPTKAEVDELEERRALVRTETHDIMKKLLVRPGDFEGQLVVHCADFVEDEFDIDRWLLQYQADEWHHYPSDSHGSLYESLFGIAACYTPTMQRIGRESREKSRALMAEHLAPPES